MTTILAVDVSSHQAPSLASVNEWIAQGAQALIIKAYTNAEQAALKDSTRRWADIAQQAHIWPIFYNWLFRSVPPEESVGSAFDLIESCGEKPGVHFLDCETYGDPVSDHGPTVDQILTAGDVANGRGANDAIYSGLWWLTGWLEGDSSRLAGKAGWLSSYDATGAVLDVQPPFGMRLLGKQYTSTPVDWSIFDYEYLAELSRGYQPAPPPAADPCAPIRASLQALVDRKPYRAPSRAKLKQLLEAS